MSGSSTGEGGSGAAGSAKGGAERIELGRREATVARRAAEGKATIPHIYLGRRVAPAGGGGDALLAGLIAASGRALAEHPALNAGYRDGGIERYSRVNVGLTIETPQGALVPTLFDADKMTVEEIAEKIEAIRGRALAGELTAPETSGGTFTLSSTRDGADSLAPIVATGQVAHLGCGRPRAAAVVEDGELRAGIEVELVVSCDGRAVRPSAAAAFLEDLAHGFERGEAAHLGAPER